MNLQTDSFIFFSEITCEKVKAVNDGAASSCKMFILVDHTLHACNKVVECFSYL